MSQTNRAEWAKRVQRWEDSGLTAKEFAAEAGVCWVAMTASSSRDAHSVYDHLYGDDGATEVGC